MSTTAQDRSCKRKKRYRNEYEAEKAVRAAGGKYGKEMRSYWCRYCNGYHITSAPMREEVLV